MTGVASTLLMAALPLMTVSDTPRAGGYDRAIEALMPRVVKLYGLGAGLQAGYGTGILVSEDGLVLTVFSLLIDARHVRAVTADGTPYEAVVVRRDRDRQLALLKLKPITPEDEPATEKAVGAFPFFDLAVVAELHSGDWVVAAGNAFKVADGAEPVSLAHGVFSTRTRLDARRRLRDFPYRGDVLVTDAITSNPGAPGGAVVNLDGAFVGMVGRVVVSNMTHTHFNYAIPRDVLYDFFMEATAIDSDRDDLANLHARETSGDSTVMPLDLGIRLSRTGYLVVLPFVDRVRAGSIAKQVGIRPDDLILSVNGRSVPDVAAYDARMRALAVGEPIDFVIRRGRTVLTVHVNVSELEGLESSKQERTGD